MNEATARAGVLDVMTQRRVAFGLDAVVTGANALAYLVLAGPLGDLFGLSSTLLRGVGAGLLVFATGVWLASSGRGGRAAVMAIVGANRVWTAGSIVAAIAQWGSPSAVGTVWIVLQAAVVGALAELQAAALRREAR